MSAAKKPEVKKVPVQAFAVRMGFYNGSRVRPGATFPFMAALDKDGKPILPKWAAMPGTPEAVVGAPKQLADTRPKAAVQAARVKSVGGVDNL